MRRVEPSEEIRRVVERWTVVIAAGDEEAYLGRISDLARALMIGTDPNAWVRGSDTCAIWALHMQETGAFPVTATEIQAWDQGSAPRPDHPLRTTGGAGFDVPTIGVTGYRQHQTHGRPAME